MEKFGFYCAVVHPKDSDGIINNVDPGQTALKEGAVWSGSALFVQTLYFEFYGTNIGYACAIYFGTNVVSSVYCMFIYQNIVYYRNIVYD